VPIPWRHKNRIPLDLLKRRRLVAIDNTVKETAPTDYSVTNGPLYKSIAGCIIRQQQGAQSSVTLHDCWRQVFYSIWKQVRTNRPLLEATAGRKGRRQLRCLILVGIVPLLQQPGGNSCTIRPFVCIGKVR